MTDDSWNRVDLGMPPFITQSHDRSRLPTALLDGAKQAHDDVLTAIQNICDSRLLDVEMTLLNKLLSRFNNNLGSHKTIQNMKKIKKCLGRWKTLHISQILEPLEEDLKKLSSMTTSSSVYIQSSLCIGHILHKLMAGVALLGQTIVYCVHTYVSAYQELLIGNFLTKMLVFMALASRIRVLCIQMMKSLFPCYKHSHGLLLSLYTPSQNVCEFPVELEQWAAERGYSVIVAPHVQDKMIHSSDQLSELLSRFSSNEGTNPEGDPDTNIIIMDTSLDDGVDSISVLKVDNVSNIEDLGEEIDRDSDHGNDNELSEVATWKELREQVQQQIRKSRRVAHVLQQLKVVENIAMKHLPKAYINLRKVLLKSDNMKVNQEEYEQVENFIERLDKKVTKMTQNEEKSENRANVSLRKGMDSRVEIGKKRGHGTIEETAVRDKKKRKCEESVGETVQIRQDLDACNTPEELLRWVQESGKKYNLTCMNNKSLMQPLMDMLQSAVHNPSKRWKKWKKRQRALKDARSQVWQYLTKNSTGSNNNVKQSKLSPSVFKFVVYSTDSVENVLKYTITNKKKLANLPNKLCRNGQKLTYDDKEYTLSDKNMSRIEEICEKYTARMPDKTDTIILTKAISRLVKVCEKQIKHS